MIKTQPQIWFIGGGNVHDNHESYIQFLQALPTRIGEKYFDWKSWIASGLSDKALIIKPNFPDKLNADYEAWKTWFEKYRDFYITAETHLIMIAHSLGGIFLSKYLSENRLLGKMEAIHLIAPVFNNEGLNGEVVGNFAFDPKNLSTLAAQAGAIHIWHSEDDPIVPYAHGLEYKKFLPQSLLHTFQDRGHFINQAHFIELFQTLLSHELTKKSQI